MKLAEYTPQNWVRKMMSPNHPGPSIFENEYLLPSLFFKNTVEVWKWQSTYLVQTQLSIFAV